MSWLTFELSIITIFASKLDPISPSFGRFFVFSPKLGVSSTKNSSFYHSLDYCAQADKSRHMASFFFGPSRIVVKALLRFKMRGNARIFVTRSEI